MSREIKFRLYDKETGEMEYLENIEIFRLYKEYPNRYELMQHTGLKDKNDQETYEGDILENYQNKDIREIKWSHARWGLVIHKLQSRKYNIEFLHNINSHEFEIIGNIYQDPELLTPPQDLDDAINLFKGYMANENHFDEIDFKTWLYDVWLVEEKK